MCTLFSDFAQPTASRPKVRYNDNYLSSSYSLSGIRHPSASRPKERYPNNWLIFIIRI